MKTLKLPLEVSLAALVITGLLLMSAALAKTENISATIPPERSLSQVSMLAPTVRVPGTTVMVPVIKVMPVYFRNP